MSFELTHTNKYNYHFKDIDGHPVEINDRVAAVINGRLVMSHLNAVIDNNHGILRNGDKVNSEQVIKSIVQWL